MPAPFAPGGASEEGDPGTPLRFTSSRSELDTSFLLAFANVKLDHDKVNEVTRTLAAFYTVKDASNRAVQAWEHDTLTIPDFALHPELLSERLHPNQYPSSSTFHNFNTLEAFNTRNPTARVQEAGKAIYSAIKDKSIYQNPSLLTSSIFDSFFDLKKYTFRYHFAFPGAPSQWSHTKRPSKLDPQDNARLIAAVAARQTDSVQSGFFLAKKDSSSESAEWVLADIAQFENGFFDNVPKERQFICFADPSSRPFNPNWMARNYLLLAMELWGLSTLQLLAFRDVKGNASGSQSVVFHLTHPPTSSPKTPSFFGWEKREMDDGSYKVIPKIIHLASQMDSHLLAKQAVDLNLRLIKWRRPDVNLDSIARSKCLLLGAGTLGCYVARQLLAWGVSKITLVDNGQISFSNPVRQPLYTFEDSTKKLFKSVQAAKALTEIFPGVDAQGKVLSIPMLGHPVGSREEEQAERSFVELCHLFEEHDVIFLLMDTRESRWLPTLMGKAMGKIVINAALGFSTYLVMRHGLSPSPDIGSIRTDEDREVETEVGCYFCPEVVSASNSTRDATLDQQCTVTRAGAAPIAAGTAVELMTSILQHPLGARAPPPGGLKPHGQSAGESPEHKFENPFGVIPHRIHGDLFKFTSQVMVAEPTTYCSACSAPIVNAFLHGLDKHAKSKVVVPAKVDPAISWKFVLKAVNTDKWVERVSGLAAAAEATNAAADWDDDDFDVESLVNIGAGANPLGVRGRANRSSQPAWLVSSTGRGGAALWRRPWFRTGLLMVGTAIFVSLIWYGYVRSLRS